MLSNSVVVVVVVVVRTRPRAIPLAMITMRKSTRGFPLLSRDKYGAPLGGPSGRRSSANIYRAAKRRGKIFRLPLFAEIEKNNCFSIYTGSDLNNMFRRKPLKIDLIDLSIHAFTPAILFLFGLCIIHSVGGE